MSRRAGSEAQCPQNQNARCTVGEKPCQAETAGRVVAAEGGEVGRSRAGSELSFLPQHVSHLLGGGQGSKATFWPLPMLPSMASLRGPPPSCMALARGASRSAFRAKERKGARSRRRRKRPASILTKLREAGTSAEGTSSCRTSARGAPLTSEDRQAGNGSF